MILELRADANANLTVTCNDFCVRVQGNPPEAARTVAMDRDTAAKCLGSTGGTQFYLNNLSAFIDDGFTIPQSELKRMRREALVLLSERMSVPLPHAFNRDASVSAFLPHKSSKPMLRLRFEKAQQVFDVLEAELIILPLSEILKNKSLIKQFGSKLACELPAICYPLRENELLTTLQELQDIGLTEVIAENLYVIKLCNDLGLNVHGGMSLNILNSVSLEQYELLGIKDATVSFELPMNRVRRLSGKLPRGVVGYGYLPLMKFRACPVQQVSGCVGCSGISTLKDRKNESFTVICRNKQYSEFLNCVPLYVADKAIENVDFITLYFTVETNEHCREIVKLFISGQTPNFRYTRGMYYRDLL